MRIAVAALVIIVLLVVGVILTSRFIGSRAATAPPSANTVAADPAPPSANTVAGNPKFTPVATVEEIMGGLVDPASKSVFGSVGTVTERGVERQKSPKNDAEWAIVRRNAALMVEGANLLMMEGRHISRNMNAPAAADGELSPAQIDLRVSNDRKGWQELAQAFSATAQVALKATEAKDAAAVFASGGELDTACENCHQRFWYPPDAAQEKPAGASGTGASGK